MPIAGKGMRSIKEFFKVENTRADITSMSTPSMTNQQKVLSEIILLSSSEEEEETRQPQKERGLRRSTRLRKATPTMKRIIASDDLENGISNDMKLTENTPEKRVVDEENEENVQDSQEIGPIKRRKFCQNRIDDSDDEDNETRANEKSTESDSQERECSQVSQMESQSPGRESDTDESEYSSDSYVSGTDHADYIDTDEEEYINSYREPDPRHLYEDIGGRKKSKRKTASYDDHQEVSIHKIKLNHYKFSRKSVEDVIDYIVEKYNDDKDKSEKKNRFEKVEVQEDYEPIVKPEEKKYFEGDDFQIKVYVQKVAKSIALLSSYGIKEKATTIHSLIFHYRTNELFAVTTNQAWNVVQWCSDFEFPGIIAARILSKDGVLASTDKGLVGTESTRKTTNKQQKQTNPFNLLSFCARFTTELRDNASILRLSCFQKKNSNAGVESDEEDEDDVTAREPCNKIKGVRMTVSLGNIRILKRFSTSDILSILSFLSKISNGEETVNLDGEVEQNSTAHKKYLTSVDTSESNELNVCLGDIIHNAIADDNRMEELDNYQFCHKHSIDFFNGYDFELYYKGNSVKKFSEKPTIKQLVVALRHDLGEIQPGLSGKGFLKLLNNAKISYHFGSNGSVKKQEKLLNFIDGLYHSRDNSVFWHVNATWRHVQDGYLHQVQTQFKNVLHDFLLTDTNDPAYLHIEWPKITTHNVTPESTLKKYLRKYSDIEDTWISDNPERDIVDMIRIGENNAGKKVFFVYYFLPGPNNQTNIKCNRIAESIMQIGKTNLQMMRQTQRENDDVAGSEDVRQQLEVVYQKVSEKRQFKNLCPNFDKFLKMITRAKFVLAIGRETSASTTTSADIPSLATEKEMPTKIAIHDITVILERMIDGNQDDDLQMLKETARTLKLSFDKSRCMQLAEAIHQQLRQHEYIEAQGNSIRGKFLSQSKNNFDFTSNGNVNKFLYEKIISKFQPRTCTVLSKLGFIHMRGEILKLTITSFNLIELPMLG